MGFFVPFRGGRVIGIPLSRAKYKKTTKINVIAWFGWERTKDIVELNRDGQESVT